MRTQTACFLDRTRVKTIFLSGLVLRLSKVTVRGAVSAGTGSSGLEKRPSRGVCFEVRCDSNARSLLTHIIPGNHILVTRHRIITTLKCKVLGSSVGWGDQMFVIPNTMSSYITAVDQNRGWSFSFRTRKSRNGARNVPMCFSTERAFLSENSGERPSLVNTGCWFSWD